MLLMNYDVDDLTHLSIISINPCSVHIRIHLPEIHTDSHSVKEVVVDDHHHGHDHHSHDEHDHHSHGGHDHGVSQAVIGGIVGSLAGSHGSSGSGGYSSGGHGQSGYASAYGHGSHGNSGGIDAGMALRSFCSACVWCVRWTHIYRRNSIVHVIDDEHFVI